MIVSFCCDGQLSYWNIIKGVTSLEKVKGKIAGKERGNAIQVSFFLLPIPFVVSETVELNKPDGIVMKHT